MTAARPSTGPVHPPGATPVGGGNRGGGRRKALILGALLLALLVLAGLLLTQCGSDDPENTSDSSARTSAGSSSSSSSDSGGSSSSSSGSSSSTPADGGAGGGAGGGQGQIVTAGGDSVLDIATGADAASGLGALADQPVTGTAVQVLSVPADEGFWVGTSDEQRVWVQLTGEEGESPYQVTEGDLVNFEGTVVAHDGGFAEQVGLAEADGAAQLTEQASHLEVAKSAISVSS